VGGPSWGVEDKTAGGGVGKIFFGRGFGGLGGGRVRVRKGRRSAGWALIELNDSVSTPSSSRLVTGAWREKSPRATACMACASVASGSARSFDCVAATATARK